MKNTSGELIDALKSGKILRRNRYPNNEGNERWEYIHCENSNYYYVSGWGSAIRNADNRLLLVINQPELFEIINNEDWKPA